MPAGLLWCDVFGAANSRVSFVPLPVANPFVTCITPFVSGIERDCVLVWGRGAQYRIRGLRRVREAQGLDPAGSEALRANLEWKKRPHTPICFGTAAPPAKVLRSRSGAESS